MDDGRGQDDAAAITQSAGPRHPLYPLRNMGGNDKRKRRKNSHGPMPPQKQPTVRARVLRRRVEQDSQARRAERAQRSAQTEVPTTVGGTEVDKDARSKDSSNSALSSDTPAAPRARDTDTAIEQDQRQFDPLASAAMANEVAAGTPDPATGPDDHRLNTTGSRGTHAFGASPAAAASGGPSPSGQVTSLGHGEEGGGSAYTTAGNSTALGATGHGGAKNHGGAKKRKNPTQGDPLRRPGKLIKGHRGHETALHPGDLQSPSAAHTPEPAANETGDGWVTVNPLNKIMQGIQGFMKEAFTRDDDGDETSDEVSEDEDEMTLATMQRTQPWIHREADTLDRALQRDKCSKTKLRGYSTLELKAALQSRGLDSSPGNKENKEVLAGELMKWWKENNKQRSPVSFIAPTFAAGQPILLNDDEQRAALNSGRISAPKQRDKVQQYRPRWNAYLQWCRDTGNDKNFGAFQPYTVQQYLVSHATTCKWTHSNLDMWSNALQWGVNHNYPEHWNNGQPGWTVRGIRCVKEQFQIIKHNKVVEQRVNEVGVLRAVKPTVSREDICKGTYGCIRQTAAEFNKKAWPDVSDGPKTHFIKQVTARFLWVAADNSLCRGQEVANYAHPGGIFMYSNAAKEMIGPTNNIGHIVMTNNCNKTNVDGNTPVFLHLFDTPCDVLFGSGTQALGELLFVNFEIGNMSLLGDREGGWQYLPLCKARLGTSGDYNTTNAISSGAHGTVFKDVKYQLGMEDVKQQMHLLRGAAAKRKGMESGNFAHMQQDMAYEPGVFEVHYRQECINITTKATGHMGDRQKIGHGRYEDAVFAPRYHQVLPSDFYDGRGTLFPNLVSQLEDPTFIAECVKKEHLKERLELLRVVEHLSETVPKWIAMLQAQVELYLEDNSSVPLFNTLELDPEELLRVMETHPVYSHKYFQTKKFEILVESMKIAWSNRHNALTNLSNQADKLSLRDIESSARQTMVATQETKSAVLDKLDYLMREINDLKATLEENNEMQRLATRRDAENRIAVDLITAGLDVSMAQEFAKWRTDMESGSRRGNDATGAVQEHTGAVQEQVAAPAARPPQVDDRQDDADRPFDTPESQPQTPPRDMVGECRRNEGRPRIHPRNYLEFTKPSDYWSIYNKGCPEEGIRPTRDIRKVTGWTTKYHDSDVKRVQKMRRLLDFLDKKYANLEEADFDALLAKVDGWFADWTTETGPYRRPPVLKYFYAQARFDVAAETQGEDDGEEEGGCEPSCE